MKRQLTKATLAVALGLGISTAAQAQIANDDLVLGFTSTGAQNDYIINLGQLLGTSAHQITLSGSQYNNSSFLANLGSSATGGNLYAGVFGGNAGSTGDIFISALSQPTQGTFNNEHQGSGFPSSVSLGLVPQSGQSVHDNISTAPGLAGANPSSLGLYVPSPLQTISASQGTGQSVVNLEVWQSTFHQFPSAATTAYSDQGFVSLMFNNDGSLGGVAWDQPAQLATVPEPTCGMFAGLGALFFALRRQFKSKTA